MVSQTLAPGISVAVPLELQAHNQRQSTFIVHVASPVMALCVKTMIIGHATSLSGCVQLGSREIRVKATVVAEPLFQSISNVLRHDGRSGILTDMHYG